VSGTAEHLALLSSDLCPEELLQIRARSRDWMVRLSIAMSRTVDRSTLEHLRLDRHWLVRSAAEDAIVRYPVSTPKPYRAGVREMTQEDWYKITKGGVLMYFGNKPKA
jgi:hypothetical protein